MKYILENDVEEMELCFVEEEYDKDGQLLKVYIAFFYLSCRSRQSVINLCFV